MDGATPLPAETAQRVARDTRVFLVLVGAAMIGATFAYYVATYRRESTSSDPDRIADAMLDAFERRELMRDAARRDAPPEV